MEWHGVAHVVDVSEYADAQHDLAAVDGQQGAEGVVPQTWRCLMRHRDQAVGRTNTQLPGRPRDPDRNWSTDML